MMSNNNSINKRIAIESLVVTLVVFTVLKFTFYIPIIGIYAATILAISQIYVPVFMSRYRSHPFVINGGGWKVGILWFCVFAIIIFPPFFILGDLWQKIIYSAEEFSLASPPSIKFIAIHLLGIALPEEVYFRGYLQSCLNKFFRPRWNILGVELGWSWVLTAAIFAFTHSVISIQWWHFAIFFPALVFGYLREKTGGIIAPTLFHASSNILMNWFIRSYF